MPELMTDDDITWLRDKLMLDYAEDQAAVSGVHCVSQVDLFLDRFDTFFIYLYLHPHFLLRR